MHSWSKEAHDQTSTPLDVSTATNSSLVHRSRASDGVDTYILRRPGTRTVRLATLVRDGHLCEVQGKVENVVKRGSSEAEKDKNKALVWLKVWKWIIWETLNSSTPNTSTPITADSLPKLLRFNTGVALEDLVRITIWNT